MIQGRVRQTIVTENPRKICLSNSQTFKRSRKQLYFRPLLSTSLRRKKNMAQIMEMPHKIEMDGLKCKQSAARHLRCIDQSALYDWSIGKRLLPAWLFHAFFPLLPFRYFFSDVQSFFCYFRYFFYNAHRSFFHADAPEGWTFSGFATYDEEKGQESLVISSSTDIGTGIHSIKKSQKCVKECVEAGGRTCE